MALERQDAQPVPLPLSVPFGVRSRDQAKEPGHVPGAKSNGIITALVEHLSPEVPDHLKYRVTGHGTVATGR